MYKAYMSEDEMKRLAELGALVEAMPVGSTLASPGYTNEWTYLETRPDTDYETAFVGTGKTPLEAIKNKKAAEG